MGGKGVNDDSGQRLYYVQAIQIELNSITGGSMSGSSGQLIFPPS